MAIGNPTERYAVSRSTQGASTTLSPATTVAAGTFAVMCVTASFAGKVVSSAGDDAGNTWVVDVTYNPLASNKCVSFVSCQVIHAITTTNVVTINYAVTNNNQTHIWIQEVTGMATSAAFDKSAVADVASGTSITTASSGTLSQAAEIVFAGARLDDATGWAHGAGYSDPTTKSLGGLSGLEYKIVAATTAVTGTASWTNWSEAAMLLATYKGGGRVPRYSAANFQNPTVV